MLVHHLFNSSVPLKTPMFKESSCRTSNYSPPHISFFFFFPFFPSFLLLSSLYVLNSSCVLGIVLSAMSLPFYKNTPCTPFLDLLSFISFLSFFSLFAFMLYISWPQVFHLQFFFFWATAASDLWTIYSCTGRIFSMCWGHSSLYWHDHALLASWRLYSSYSPIMFNARKIHF